MSRQINRDNSETLPNGWHRERLGDIAKITTGGTPSRENATFWNGAIPWITTSLIDFNVIDSAEEFITPEGVASSAAKVFPAGTLLIAMFGQGVTRGKVAALGMDAAFNQACVAISPFPLAHPAYLFHYLAFNYEAIRNLANSGSQENLNAGLIKSIQINVPPLAEQKAIAAVLSAWDRAIEQTAALIAAKERLKQGLMQQLLSGQRRLRQFRDKWRQCHLGDVFSDRREAGYDGLPMLSVTLDAGVVRRASRDNPVRTSLEHDEHLLVRKGDIAYNMMRMWQGGSGMAREDGVVSPAYVVCQPSVEIDSRFADHLFHTPRMIFLFWAYSYGLTDDRRRLYFDGFSRIPVELPSVAEQRKIADIIDRLDGELHLLRQKRDSLGVQKRGLMQQLLTGTVRVPKSLLKEGSAT